MSLGDLEAKGLLEEHRVQVGAARLLPGLGGAGGPGLEEGHPPLRRLGGGGP
jgi:hypothetical protein